MFKESNHLPDIESEDAHCSEQAPPAIHCANCDIDILWTPVRVQDKSYCCTGCAAGGPCNCDYSLYRSTNISGVIHYHVEISPESEDQYRR